MARQQHTPPEAYSSEQYESHLGCLYASLRSSDKGDRLRRLNTIIEFSLPVDLFQTMYKCDVISSKAHLLLDRAERNDMVAAFEYLLANLARLDERAKELAEVSGSYDPGFAQRQNSLEAFLLKQLSLQLKIKMKRHSSNDR